ncbi:hypothetical protein V495_02068 [Pseudogymnoascus sp. VKM F-4514 (FW-929)]|nr:hypothetical protein V495_02068 [Pseudogymnoascus sp. VKM F-4514 (FW-929)]
MHPRIRLHRLQPPRRHLPRGDPHPRQTRLAIRISNTPLPPHPLPQRHTTPHQLLPVRPALHALAPSPISPPLPLRRPDQGLIRSPSCCARDHFSPSALLSTPSHPRPSHLPSLSASQIKALSALQAVARATELHIGTQAGDLHFVNNLAIMHRRSAFSPSAVKSSLEMGEEDQPKRHLVRMRLRCPERGWKIPPALAPAWEEAFGEEGEREWHLFPMPEGYFPLRKYPE